MKSRYNKHGFSLIEVIVVLVVLGILASVAIRTLRFSLDDRRQSEAERNLQYIEQAIVGRSELAHGGMRSDFGYLGDVGAFPFSLDALWQNPGGFNTWHGPYLPSGFEGDSLLYKFDPWGSPYQYDGALVITSVGGGTPLNRTIAGSPGDYLNNLVYGTIRDVNDSVPGFDFMDSVYIALTVPDGAGGLTTRTAHPNASGAFSIDSLPVGTHELKIIFAPEDDTLLRYITVFPRHKSSPAKEFRFASAHFSPGGCTGETILRPDGIGANTNLDNQGCGDNWECLAETDPDYNSTYVKSSGTSYLTDTYSVENPIDTACPIAVVTIHMLVRRFVKAGFARAVINISGVDFFGPEETLTDDFVVYARDWVVNPATGLPWGWTDIAAMEAGVSLRASKATNLPRCTQVWVTVDYAE